jgi:hypothetical protein
MEKLMKKLILGLLVCASLLQAKNLQYEIGLGVPYAVIGGNINYEVTNDFDAFVGLGATQAGGGYSIGTRYYATNNIRLTGVYGTNTVVKTIEYVGFGIILSEYDSYEGLSFGIGYYSSKDSGFGIDLMYIATSNTPEGVEDDTGVTLSLGYRF